MASIKIENVPTSVSQKRISQDTPLQLDLELSIETKRIINVIDCTITKLELVMCLPILLDHSGSALEPHLSSEELTIVTSCADNLTKIFSKVSDESESQDSIETIMALGIDEVRKRVINMRNSDKSHYASSWSNSSVKPGKTEQTISALESRKDRQIYKVVTLLSSKPCLRSLIKDHLISQPNYGARDLLADVFHHASKLKIRRSILIDLSGTTKVISPAAQIFLDYIHHLRVCVLKRLSISPEQERSYDQLLRQLWQQNEQAKHNISVLRTNLECQRNQGNSQLAEKNLIINKHREKIEKLKKYSGDDIKKIINQSECAMVTEWKDSEYQLRSIQVEVNESQTTLSGMLTHHLYNEKELRDERYEVESQLVALLAKYDVEMGERQKELEKINAGFNEEKQQMLQLQEQFNIQEVEYNALMAEKADAERQELETRLYIFLVSRSVRKIQRYWREYRVRKLARRKGRRKPKRDSAKGKGPGSKDSGKKKK